MPIEEEAEVIHKYLKSNYPELECQKGYELILAEMGLGHTWEFACEMAALQFEEYLKDLRKGHKKVTFEKEVTFEMEDVNDEFVS